MLSMVYTGNKDRKKMIFKKANEFIERNTN
jgi:hypothetical protein